MTARIQRGFASPVRKRRATCRRRFGPFNIDIPPTRSCWCWLRTSIPRRTTFATTMNFRQCTTRGGEPMDVPSLDLHAAYRELKDDLDDAYRRVMSSGWYVLGAEVEAFETEFARY